MGKVFRFLGFLFNLGFSLLFFGVVFWFASLEIFFVSRLDEPMPVAEAQAKYPGLTFRQFHDVQLAKVRDVDKNRAEKRDKENRNGCEHAKNEVGHLYAHTSTATLIFYTRMNPAYEDTARKLQPHHIPPAEILFGDSFYEAAWWGMENYYWRLWQSPCGVDRISPYTGPLPESSSGQ